jgi:hypothetical protein
MNDNFADIEAALENTLSRDGSSPNQMEADLDMNHHRIKNTQDAVNTGDAVNLGQLTDMLVDLAGGQVVIPGPEPATWTIDLFVDAGTAIIAPDTELIQTSGYSEMGKGVARYVYDATVDAAYVLLHPRSSFIADDGRGFRLSETEVNPYMFGALGGATPDWVADGTEKFIASNEGDFTDDTEAVQACLDFQFDNPDVFVNLEMDRWAISDTIYAVYPYVGWNLHRKFRGGYFYLLPTFSATEALVIGGHGLQWAGQIFVDGGTRSYSYRRCSDQLIRITNCNGSSFDAIYVEGCKRHGVYMDPNDGTETFRTGTAYEVTNTFSNNIGVKFGLIQGRTLGYSTTWDLELAYPVDMPAYTATNGGSDGNTGEWVADVTGMNASHAQRSQLTMDTTVTDDLRVGDIGRTRLIMHPSEFTGYATDATAGTITLTAGDPVAKGFVVGGPFRVSHGSSGGMEFTIKGFSGTDNRIVEVYPKPAETVAAIEVPSFGYIDGGFNHHVIMTKTNPTTVEVFPWLSPDTVPSGQWEGAHGAVFACVGNNTAQINVTTLYGYGVGVVLLQSGLYGPHIGNLLAEYCEIGFQHGTGFINTAIGTVIDSAHFEACVEDIVQVTQIGSFELNSSSSFAGGNLDPFRDVTILAARQFQADLQMMPRALDGAIVKLAGEIYHGSVIESYIGTSGSDWTTNADVWVSNRPSKRDRLFAYNSGTIALDWVDGIGRAFGEHNRARIVWTSPTGGVPSGTLTIELTDAMDWAGWTLTGSGIIATPATALEIIVLFDAVNKNIQLFSQPLTAVV